MALADTLPDVPVTVSVRVPFRALLVTVTVSVPVLPKGTGLVTTGVMPVVPPLTVNATELLNPPEGMMFTV